MKKQFIQLCLQNDKEHLDNSYSQKQLAEVLGCHQTLISVRKAELKRGPVCDLGTAAKRSKRQDAFEVEHADLVEVVEQFWVRNSFKFE